ncbi:MAG: DUF1385 domain-containing protein [Candidatus Sumerlaeia bacterium]|nr:DUF1385 domain-containing protein [Candidatus Sumerlaeia bacterium]
MEADKTPDSPGTVEETRHRNDPIHFHGVIPNASRTPRNEVGGLALFDGVLMRSRTGFATAIRRPDGLIHIRQVPLLTLVERRRVGRIPLLRGAMSLLEMMIIGTKALRESTRTEEDDTPVDPDFESRRMGILLTISIGILVAMLIVLPVLASVLLPFILTWTGLIGATGAEALNKVDSPVVMNLFESGVRIVLILVYLAAISLDGEVRRVFQYHGAEHKAVLALEEGRDVTVDRARRHDTLHPRCGTTFLALLVLASVLVFFLSDILLATTITGYAEWGGLSRRLAEIFLHLLLLPFLIGLCFELIRFAARHQGHRFFRALLWPGFILQRFTTRHPNDHQLEVAIVALFGALAISPNQREPKDWIVRGLEDDESAPGYVPQSPARPAPPTPGTVDALPRDVEHPPEERAIPHGPE